MSILALSVDKDYWQQVLEKLVQEGVEVKYSVVHYRYKNVQKAFFDKHKVELVDGTAFYKLQTISELIQQHFGADYEVLDKNIVDYFEAAERDFYNLTDRYSYIPVSFRTRKRLFRDGIRFWLTFLKKNKITAVLASCSPHNLPDYTAYHAAKYLGIPTLSPSHTMINDHVIMRHDYREVYKVPEKFLSGIPEKEIKNSIPAELYKASFLESKVLAMVIDKNKEAQKISAKKSGFKPIRKLKVLAKNIKKLFSEKPSFKGATAMNSYASPQIRRIIKIYDKYWQGKQRGFHDSLAAEADLTQKYVYFAMHLQPERTSTPEAGVFEDHLLAIDILAKSLPKGWKLYVKENPRQFDKKMNVVRGHHARERTDYNDILRLQNVHLIGQKTPTKDLIKNAQVVSTLSGSVGWEALQAKKPVIVFANAWYSPCNSCYIIENASQAKSAIKDAQAKNPGDVNLDLLKYIAFMQDKLFIGCMGDEAYLAAATVPVEELVQSMANRINSELKGEAYDQRAKSKKNAR